MSTDSDNQVGVEEQDDRHRIWSKERDRIKTLWVIAVVMFWFTLFFQGTLLYLDGQVNLVLLSIVTGMLILGVILKIRLKLHLRKEP
ncbi:MAG: hypothetical protein KDI63_02680 [Gammaproteobacteria bacterium]|nr:hypothetical protein [Gammaproteobacteria bacterium]